jgi:hypothetical protein
MSTILLDIAYWVERYENEQTGWDIGFCSTPLKTYFDQLTDKNIKILIPGAGFGHEAIYLYNKGFRNVHVLDLVSQPLQNIQNKCPDFPPSQLHIGDFFEHDGSYDLIIEQTFFCAIDPTLRGAYVNKMRSLIREKGKLVGVLFDRNFEGGPPFGGNAKEYEKLFKPSFNMVYIEPCYNSIPQRAGSEVFIKVA